MSLYIKYRPTDLESVKGNENIIASLEKMLSNLETCPHVFLLHGGTGQGKTTIARIIAKKLGCIGSDYREYNASDDTGIDGVRQIIRNSNYKPMEGACRVWTIDECHRWTPQAQDSVLKILEDTPPHIYFILCTTEPNKLKSTIRGRCIEMQVKPLTDQQMKGLLRGIVREEGETLSAEIYAQIIQDSQGHPRNAIQILEQVLNVDEDKRLEVAQRSAEIQSQSIELCRVLLKKSSWKEVNSILVGLKDQEPEDIRRVVMGYCSAVLLKSDNTRAAMVLEYFLEPFYNSGMPGLVFAAYSVTKS
ncbi:MAG: AAA family ATPase [Candidatus Paceibacterota bacterium]|jgi:DNA polymerase-3 subunit gamma/tau